MERERGMDSIEKGGRRERERDEVRNGRSKRDIGRQ